MVQELLGSVECCWLHGPGCCCCLTQYQDAVCKISLATWVFKVTYDRVEGTHDLTSFLITITIEVTGGLNLVICDFKYPHSQ